MSAERVPVSLTVEMGGRDVTEFVESFTFRQPKNVLYREFTLTFRAWHNIQPDERWDVWGSYDPTNPKAELLIRQGVMPPDRQTETVLAEGSPPLFTVNGYDSVWLAQRKTPAQTVVIADSISSANQALANYSGAVGRYRVHRMSRIDLRSVVGYLGRQAGFNVELRIPNANLVPFVIPPTSSYWRALADLVAPWAPYIYFKAETNTVFISDPMSAQSGIGQTMNIDGSLVRGLQSIPAYTKKVRRVVVRVVA